MRSNTSQTLYGLTCPIHRKGKKRDTSLDWTWNVCIVSISKQ